MCVVCSREESESTLQDLRIVFVAFESDPSLSYSFRGMLTISGESMVMPRSRAFVLLHLDRPAGSPIEEDRYNPPGVKATAVIGVLGDCVLVALCFVVCSGCIHVDHPVFWRLSWWRGHKRRMGQLF